MELITAIEPNMVLTSNKAIVAIHNSELNVNNIPSANQSTPTLDSLLTDIITYQLEERALFSAFENLNYN